MEQKIYGKKPSYKFMKEHMLNRDGIIGTSFFNHGANLVYYCIKHDFNEDQVKEYLEKEVNKCEKYLNNSIDGINFRVEYKFFKDVLNVDLNIFKLYHTRWFKSIYNHEKKRCEETTEIDDHFIYRESYEKSFYENLFRGYNEHIVYLYDSIASCSKYVYKGPIRFSKMYDKEGTNDVVYVKIVAPIFPAGNNKYSLQRVKKEFIEGCLFLWHFIKTLDVIEETNNIDLKNEVYKRLEVYHVTDNTGTLNIDNQKVKEHKKSGFQKLVSKILSNYGRQE